MVNPPGIWTQDVTVKVLCLNPLTSGSLYFFFVFSTLLARKQIYPKNDLNVYDVISINLKFILSTNSSTRILIILYNVLWIVHKARVTWTLIWAIMSSLLYQLSYSLFFPSIRYMRTKDLHLQLLVMSQLCYCYTNPHFIYIYPFFLFFLRFQI